MSHLLVDGNNLAVRCWKGLPPLTNSKGESVSTLFGVIKAIKSALDKFNPISATVFWDGSPAARKRIYPTYKMQRKEAREQYTEEEQQDYEQFKWQVERLKTILPCFGVDQAFESTTEADDLIAAAVRQLESAIILSEDKDFIQLVSESVKLHRPMTGRTYTKDNLLELTGFDTTSKYLQFRIINGDTSDDIPGVPGFGGEGLRARKLINDHHSVTNILKKTELNVGKVMNKLFNNRDLLVRNTLLMDLSLSEHYLTKPLIECLVASEFDLPSIKKHLMRFEFFSLLGTIKEFTANFSKLTNFPV